MTYDLKWLTVAHIDWYRFFIQASVMVGILPAYLNEKYGPRLSFGVGAILLTISQILALTFLASGAQYKTVQEIVFFLISAKRYSDSAESLDDV